MEAAVAARGATGHSEEPHPGEQCGSRLARVTGNNRILLFPPGPPAFPLQLSNAGRSSKKWLRRQGVSVGSDNAICTNKTSECQRLATADLIFTDVAGQRMEQ